MTRPPALAILALPLVAALLLSLFAWPAARLEPRDLRVGVAGTGPAARAVEQRLSAIDGAYDIHRYTTAAEARRAVADRDVHGAFVSDRTGATLLTASAGSAAVAAQLERTLRDAAPSGRVVDVVPAPAEDPRGTALAAAVLPLAISGILTGASAGALGSTALGRAGLVVAGSAGVGLVATGVLHGWLGVTAGDWTGAWLASSLMVLAVAAAASGLGATLGRAGLALAGISVVLVGNAFSGAASDPELLPEPVGALGQLLPPGAGAALLRSATFFDGADAAGHIGVLLAWTLAGLAALLMASRLRHHTSTHRGDPHG